MATQCHTTLTKRRRPGRTGRRPALWHRGTWHPSPDTQGRWHTHPGRIISTVGARGTPAPIGRAGGTRTPVRVLGLGHVAPWPRYAPLRGAVAHAPRSGF